MHLCAPLLMRALRMEVTGEDYESAATGKAQQMADDVPLRAPPCSESANHRQIFLR